MTIPRFSSGTPGTLPVGWHAQTFRRTRPTGYRVVRDGDRLVLEAASRNAASALIAEADLDPFHAPWIEWSWKIGHVLVDAAWGRKSTDDFPARLFVIFAEPGETVETLLSGALRTGRARALNYVWANDQIAGRMAPSPYTTHVVMIAVEAGSAHSGAWVAERRNIVDDFRRAFRAMPPPVRAVAIMTDTDNTHGRVTTRYGDIRFVGGPNPPPRE